MKFSQVVQSVRGFFQDVSSALKEHTNEVQAEQQAFQDGLQKAVDERGLTEVTRALKR